MADITKINGYELKDAVSRSDIAGIKDGTIKVGKAANADNASYAEEALVAEGAFYYLTGTPGASEGVGKAGKTIEAKFTEVETTIQNVANGVNRGYSFNSVDALIGALEAETSNTKYKIGDELYIKSADKPDYWVAEVKDTKGAAVTSIGDGTVVGYWALYKLGEKTDLTQYQTKTDTGLATTNKNVVGAINEVRDSTGVALEKADEALTKFRRMGYSDIGPTINDEVRVYLNQAAALVAYKDAGGRPIDSTYIKGLSVSGRTLTYTKGDGNTGTLTTQDTTYAQATSTVLGLVKIGYAASGRNYPVVLDADGKMYVSVPWSDTVYTLPAASATVRGGAKVGAVRTTAVTTEAAGTTAGRYYMVERDSAEKLFVNIPWQNTTYSVATQSANGLMSAADKKKLDHIAISVVGEEMTITLA